MGKRKNAKQLEKLVTYVLGRRPDEFGLVLDDQGWTRLRDLVKAISEEPGWGYVRKSHIHEVLVTAGEKPFVLDEERIRAVSRDDIPHREEDVFPPKLLYHCLRRRAHAVVAEKGIRTSGQAGLPLATTEELAQRMGKRRDAEPVLLTVQAQRAFEAGVKFAKYGELIYITDHVPLGYFTGPPPPPLEKTEARKPGKAPPPIAEDLPGSFILDAERSRALQQQRLKRKGLRKEITWKQEVRKSRRKGRR
jgi:putative RNA 2'-phosphotransferase